MDGGYQSFTAFWLGGASAPTIVPAATPPLDITVNSGQHSIDVSSGQTFIDVDIGDPE